jgi:hypothetical protein
MIARIAALLIFVVIAFATGSVKACDLYDRDCWQAKRDRTINPDASGYNLHQRNQMCEDMAMAVHNTGQRVLGHVYARHLTASPEGKGYGYSPENNTGVPGYLDPGYVHEIEREIVMTVNVANRDIRGERYDGADINKCADIAQEARVKLWRIRDALP